MVKAAVVAGVVTVIGVVVVMVGRVVAVAAVVVVIWVAVAAFSRKDSSQKIVLPHAFSPLPRHAPHTH